MTVARLIGFILGFAITLIVVYVFLKKANIDGKSKTEYDERQKIIRGDAYRIGFYAGVVYFGIIMLIGVSEIGTIFSMEQIGFMGILIMCAVQCTYSIFKGAYWGLNNNKNKYMAFLLVIAVLNMIPAIISMTRGTFLIRAGEHIVGLGGSFINLLCGIFLIVICGAAILKGYMDKREEED